MCDGVNVCVFVCARAYVRVGGVLGAGVCGFECRVAPQEAAGAATGTDAARTGLKQFKTTVCTWGDRGDLCHFAWRGGPGLWLGVAFAPHSDACTRL